MPRVLRNRIIFLCVSVGLLAGTVGYRLYTLQVEQHESFAVRATQQHQGEFSLPARRGSLLDRHGRALAVSLETRSFYAHPRRVEDPEKSAAVLASKIELSQAEIVKQLESNEPFVYLQRFLEADMSRAIEQLGRANGDEEPLLPLGPNQPFHFETETRRFYPLKHVAAHVIGKADMDGTGVAGSEQRFGEQLQGDPTSYLVLRDAKNGLRRQVVREPARQSSDVRLTLDLSLQHLLERELDNALRETGAKAATAVILDPGTGQVLAMANRPTVDRSARVKPRGDARANRAIERPFEPGSTFKIVPIALALEHGTIDLGERFYCHDGKPYRTKYGRDINDVGKNGMLTPRSIISKSSNIGIVKINERLDSKTLREGILRFGFGQRTGIELPAESTGLFAPLDKWTAYTHDSLAFGQEITATALQIASAMATIANDGVRVEPRVGLGRQDADGVLHPFDPAPAHRVVSPATARTVRDMLEEVVEKGSGSAARLPGYRVAGKSGTAQKSVEGVRGYHPTDYYASFVGFAPASDPALVVLVALDSPRGSRWQGGEVAAPVFAGILAEALQYLRVPKDAEPPLATDSAPIAQILAPANTLDRPDTTPGLVPDVRGRTLREAIATLSAQGYRVRVKGNGLVATQTPEPGTALEPGGVCDLRAGSRGGAG
jgi:cell division protein FtsI (penicillin-binding protein 3)